MNNKSDEIRKEKVVAVLTIKCQSQFYGDTEESHEKPHP
jgi:hypothetical protein